MATRTQGCEEQARGKDDFVVPFFPEFGGFLCQLHVDAAFFLPWTNPSLKRSPREPPPPGPFGVRWTNFAKHATEKEIMKEFLVTRDRADQHTPQKSFLD